MEGFENVCKDFALFLNIRFRLQVCLFRDRDKQSIECRESVADVGNRKVVPRFQPCGVEIFVRDEVAKIALCELYVFRLFLGQHFLKHLSGKSLTEKELNLLFRKKFVENKTKNIVFIFIGFYLGAHLIG